MIPELKLWKFSPFLVSQFGVGILGLIWTICLNISDHFGLFGAILGHFLANFAPFGHFFYHFWPIWFMYRNLVWMVFVWHLAGICMLFGWYLCMGGMASLCVATMYCITM